MQPDETRAWPVSRADEITAASLEGLPAGILVVGCGAEFEPPPPGLAAGLRASGIVLEWMATGPACRTFNVLLLEDRRVAAALIALP